MKTARNAQNHEFCRRRKSRVLGVTWYRNPPETRKLWVITHKHGNKCLKITSFADAAIVVYERSQGIEILPELKIMGNNTRKRPEMAENMSFADAARVVYRGSHGNKILPGTENHGI